EQTLAKVYDEVLYARGYALVDGEYIYAEEADVARSIKGVAISCLIQENTVGCDDVTDTNLETFQTYAGGAYDVIENDGIVKNAYNVKTAVGTITAQNALEAGTYSVYVGAKKFDEITVSGDGKATVTITDLGSTISKIGKENNVSLINESGEVYQVPFVSATHTISTKDEFEAYLKSYDNASPSEAQIAEEKTWYAVLTNDIVLTEQWVYARTQNSWLYGTFDGLGHTVKGTVFGYGVYGMFGGLTANATVKNIGFENLIGIEASTTHHVLSGYMSGTMENVYVKGTPERAPRYVKIAYSGEANRNGIMKNCVFDVTYVGTQERVTTGGEAKDRTNVFTIGNTTDTLCTNYATQADFLATQAENITAENGWNMNVWSVGNFGLCFGGDLVARYAVETKDTVYGASYTYANNAYTKQDTFTVDVSSLIGEATDYTVLLDGEEIQTNGVLTLNVADYTMASRHEVIVAANGKVYSQPFMVVSHAISTIEQFGAYLRSYDNTSPSEAQIAEETTWYAVLTNDIVFTEEWVWGRASNSWLRGTFDGLGYIVKGPVFGYGVYGLFGGVSTGAVVKNIGFDNLYGHDGSTTHNVLSGYMTGTMENVYVKTTTAKSPQYVRLMGGTIKNCVFDVTFMGTVGKTIWNSWGTKTNNFSIGNANAESITTNYATVADFISAELAKITEANGWNMNVWSVKEGKLYFGTALVG
ncbi:MAG: hypothetical protein J6S04_07185, partial [Clostridia bacterium]|nr:hypothetical protein [Clostridia bacterium]